MAQAVGSRTLTITTAYEPRAGSSRGRTKAGQLKKEARQWRDGLAWAAKLELLGSGLALQPPYAITVNGYFPPQGPEDLPRPHDWFEPIVSALSAALDVEPAQIQVRPGRVGYAQPFSPAHFEIVVSEASQPLENHITCPSCGEPWALDPILADDDCCPHCGHENAGLPYMLGMV